MARDVGHRHESGVPLILSLDSELLHLLPRMMVVADGALLDLDSHRQVIASSILGVLRLNEVGFILDERDPTR